jgi:2-phosphoglycolate phosphatase
MLDSDSRIIRAVIFDLDGTLADTFELIVRAWNAALAPLAGRTYSDAEVISRFGIPDPAMIRRELDELSRGSSGDAAVETYHACYEREHDRVKSFDGIDSMLQALRERKVPLGLCTGKGTRSARITLSALGWSQMFGAVVTGEDVVHQKPDPEPLRKAAAILGVAPGQCAFVGDSPADIGAGQAAGMLTVAAGWHPVYHEKIRAMKPDIWAQTPADVLAILSRTHAGRIGTPP